MSSRKVGWKIDTGVSRRCSSLSWPVANSSTHRATTEATNSIRELSRSATSAMPSGSAHAPNQSATGPTWCVCHIRTPATPMMPVRLTTDTAR